MMAASKPTSYLSKAKHFLSHLALKTKVPDGGTPVGIVSDLGTLIDDLGSSPRVREALPPRTHCYLLHRGIRSLAGKPTHKGTVNHSVLYPLDY